MKTKELIKKIWNIHLKILFKKKERISCPTNVQYSCFDNDTDIEDKTFFKDILTGSWEKRIYVNVIFKKCDASYTNFENSTFKNCKFEKCDLMYAYFGKCTFEDVKFVKCNCQGVNYYNAQFTNTVFLKCNMENTYLMCSNFNDAMVCPSIKMKCPETGSFIGYKICTSIEGSRALVKLEIPEDAKRLSGTSKKCRCDKAKVVDITIISTGDKINMAKNEFYPMRQLNYVIGEYVYADSFDENRWNCCTHGIHFFMDKDDAIMYRK